MTFYKVEKKSCDQLNNTINFYQYCLKFIQIFRGHSPRKSPKFAWSNNFFRKRKNFEMGRVKFRNFQAQVSLHDFSTSLTKCEMTNIYYLPSLY